MASILSAGTTNSTALNLTADTSGSLILASNNNVTAVTIATNQNVTFANNATFPTTIGVGGATPSASGSGISFPATQSASSDANTLDDYEEGTWTPKNSTGTNLSINNTATYIKIGKLVFINADINQLSQDSVYNLPFTVASTGYPGSVICGFNSYSSQPITGVFSGNQTLLTLYYAGNNGIAPTNARFVISGCYVASA